MRTIYLLPLCAVLAGCSALMGEKDSPVSLSEMHQPEAAAAMALMEIEQKSLQKNACTLNCSAIVVMQKAYKVGVDIHESAADQYLREDPASFRIIKRADPKWSKAERAYQDWRRAKDLTR